MWNYDKTPFLTNKFRDWESFKNNLEIKIFLSVSIKYQIRIDYEINKLIYDIQQSAWKNIPEKKIKLKFFDSNNYPAEIMRYPQDKTKLINLSQYLRREIQYQHNSLKIYLRESYNENPNDYSLPKAMKNF